MCRKLVLFLLLLCSLVPVFGQEVEQSGTTIDTAYLREVFRSILMNTEASAKDLMMLDNLFNEWEKEINQLPQMQEELSNIYQENRRLKVVNIVLIVGFSLYIILN